METPRANQRTSPCKARLARRGVSGGNASFPLARGGAGEHEVGHVGAGDEQHQAHGA